jgi:hypothetical protein
MTYVEQSLAKANEFIGAVGAILERNWRGDWDDTDTLEQLREALKEFEEKSAKLGTKQPRGES